MLSNGIQLKTCLKIGCQLFPILDSEIEELKHIDHEEHILCFEQICNYIKNQQILNPEEKQLELFTSYQIDEKLILFLYDEFRRAKTQLLIFISNTRKQLEKTMVTALPNFKTLFQPLKLLEDCEEFDNKQATKTQQIINQIQQIRSKQQNPFKVTESVKQLVSIQQEFENLKRQFILLRTQKHILFEELARIKKLKEKKDKNNVNQYENEQIKHAKQKPKRQQSFDSKIDQQRIEPEDQEIDNKNQNEKKPVFIYTGKLRQFQVFTEQEQINILVQCLQSPWLFHVQQQYNVTRTTLSIWQNRYINQCLDIVESQNIFYYRRKGWERQNQQANGKSDFNNLPK